MYTVYLFTHAFDIIHSLSLKPTVILLNQYILITDSSPLDLNTSQFCLECSGTEESWCILYICLHMLLT